ncbi:MAG: 50S ribosomal protein L31e [Candidatus Norongarragalinales archaeon]
MEKEKEAKEEKPESEEETEESAGEIEEAKVGAEETEIKVEAETEEKEEEIVSEESLEAEEKPAAEEEKARPKREEKVEEEEIVEERIYTVPLGKAWIMPPNKRAARAVRILKDFLKKHMKLEARKESEEEEEPKRLIITNEVNERIWSRGIEKPPRKIRVRAAKDKDGNVTVYLAEGD